MKAGFLSYHSPPIKDARWKRARRLHLISGIFLLAVGASIFCLLGVPMILEHMHAPVMHSPSQISVLPFLGLLFIVTSYLVCCGFIFLLAAWRPENSMAIGYARLAALLGFAVGVAVGVVSGYIQSDSLIYDRPPRVFVTCDVIFLLAATGTCLMYLTHRAAAKIVPSSTSN